MLTKYFIGVTGVNERSNEFFNSTDSQLKSTNKFEIHWLIIHFLNV